MILTFAILTITITLFVWGRLRADLVALLSLLALWLGGVIDLGQALAGFGDPTVIMIAALFVIGEGLSRTGITAWLGEHMLAFAESSRLRLLIILMGGTAILSAFISNTGTVATLMPAVISASWRIGSVPSAFLMPLAFAANTGGLLTLTGTPPNIIVNGILLEAGFEAFGYFEFALIGLPLLIVAIGYFVVIGRRNLPQREVGEKPPVLTESMSELAKEYTLEDTLFWLRVRYGSSLIGKTLAQSGLGRDYNITVLRIQSTDQLDENAQDSEDHHTSPRLPSFEMFQLDQINSVPGPNTIVNLRDVLLVNGTQDAINQVMLQFNVGAQAAQSSDGQLVDMLLSHEVGVAEVLLAPRSAYIGRTLSEARMAEKYNVRVLGIKRQDKRFDQLNVKLQLGDALLIRGRWHDIELLSSERRNFVVVGSPEAMARQVVEPNPQALIASLALVSMIIMMVTGIVPTVIAALIAAIIMVVGGCLTMEQAYRSISWESIVLIASMIPMSIALQVSGGAEFLANGLVSTLGSLSPLILLLGVFVLTTALSQVINNSATTILVAPIVMAAAIELGLSPYPFLMVVTISASTAFLTPIGTTTNLMVTTPAGYKFSDFVKVGSPLIIIFILVTIILVPILWPFLG